MKLKCSICKTKIRAKKTCRETSGNCNIFKLLNIETNDVADANSIKIDKASLEKEYLKIVNNETSKQHSNKCENCDIDMRVIENEALMVCPGCGECEEMMILVLQNDQLSSSHVSCSYKRIQHFEDKLKAYLCRKTVNIPEVKLKRMDTRQMISIFHF